MSALVSKWKKSLAGDPVECSNCIAEIKAYFKTSPEKKTQYALYIFSSALEVLKAETPNDEILSELAHFLFNLTTDERLTYLKYLCNYSIYLNKNKLYQKLGKVISFLKYVVSENADENIDLYSKITQNLLSIYYNDKTLQTNKAQLRGLSQSYVDLFKTYKNEEKKFEFFYKVIDMKLVQIFLSMDIEIATQFWTNLINVLPELSAFTKDSDATAFYQKIIALLNTLFQLGLNYEDCCYHYILHLLKQFQKSKLLPVHNKLNYTLIDILINFTTLFISAPSALYQDIQAELENFVQEKNYKSHPDSVEVALLMSRYFPSLIERLMESDKNYLNSENTLHIFKIVTVLIKIICYVECNTNRGYCNKCTNTKRHVAINLGNFVLKLYENLNTNDKLSDTIKDYFYQKVKYIFTVFEGLNCANKSGALLKFCIRIYNIVRVHTIKPENGLSLVHVDLLQLMFHCKTANNFNEITDLQILRLLQYIFADSEALIDVLCIKVLVQIKTEAVLGKAVKSDVYNIKILQNKYESTQSILEAMESKAFNKFGFPIGEYNKSDLIMLEMETIFQYSLDKSNALFGLFSRLRAETENILLLGHALIYLTETDYWDLETDFLENLLRRIVDYEPSTGTDRFSKHLVLGQMYYRKYFHELLVIKNHTKAIMSHISTDAIKKNEIGEIVNAIQIDEELRLIALLDNSISNYQIMLNILIDSDFHDQYVEKIVSMVKVIRNLENIVQQYSIRFFEGKAIEVNLMVYILAKYRQHDISIMTSLGYIVENPLCMAHAASLYPAYFSKPIDELIEELRQLVHAKLKTFEECTNLQRFSYVKCLISLSKYYAIVADYHSSHEYLKQADKLINEMVALDTKKGHSYVKILRAIYCYAYFNLVSKSNEVVEQKSRSYFIRQLLREIADIKEMPAEITSQLIIIIIQSVVHLLNLIISCYDISGINAYTYMLLKVGLRNTLGIHTAYIYTTAILIDLNSENLNDAKVKLSQIEAILTLRNQEKTKDVMSVKKVMQPREKLEIITGSSLDVDSLFETRKSARSPMRKLELFNLNHGAERKLDNFHNDNCTCKFCTYPQLKLIAFQYNYLSARLLYMQDEYNSCEDFYKNSLSYSLKLSDLFNSNTNTSALYYSSLRYDFNTFMIRSLLHYSQVYVQRNMAARANKICKLAVNMVEQYPDMYVPLVQDVFCHLSNIETLDEFNRTKADRAGQTTTAMNFDDFCRYALKQMDKTPAIKRSERKVPKTIAVCSKTKLVFSSDDFLDNMAMPIFNACSEKKKNKMEIFADSPKSAVASKPCSELDLNKLGVRKKLLIDNLKSDSPPFSLVTPKKTVDPATVMSGVKVQKSTRKRNDKKPSLDVEKTARKTPGRRKIVRETDVLSTPISSDKASPKTVKKSSKKTATVMPTPTNFSLKVPEKMPLTSVSSSASSSTSELNTKTPSTSKALARVKETPKSEASKKTIAAMKTPLKSLKEIEKISSPLLYTSPQEFKKSALKGPRVVVTPTSKTTLKSLIPKSISTEAKSAAVKSSANEISDVSVDVIEASITESDSDFSVARRVALNKNLNGVNGCPKSAVKSKKNSPRAHTSTSQGDTNTKLSAKEVIEIIDDSIIVDSSCPDNALVQSTNKTTQKLKDSNNNSVAKKLTAKIESAAVAPITEGKRTLRNRK